jgi:hypothetical protein
VAFESGRELEWIGQSTFFGCPLQCLYLPQSVDFLGSHAFSLGQYIACVYFDCHSPLWQLKSDNFSRLSNLRAITIPAPIRQIHRSAFSYCTCLSYVISDSPSHCWYIAFEAFSYCSQLQSFFLPPSLEVIDSGDYSLTRLLPPFLLLIVPTFVWKTIVFWIDDHTLIR